MRYYRIEKAEAAENKWNEEKNEIAKIYARSDSMEEFKVNVDLAGLSNSKLIKWFKLFYFVKNYNANCMLPSIPISLGALMIVVSFIGVSLMSLISTAQSWQCACAVVFLILIASSVIATVAFGMSMYRKLDDIKSAVWCWSKTNCET